MTKPILAVYAIIKDWQLKEITETAQEYEVKLKKDITEEDLSRIQIVYGWNKYLSEKKDQLTQLRWIQKETAGLDSIPEEIRNNEHITISNMSGVHAVPITENVFGYIMSVARGIIAGIKSQQDKQWNKDILSNMFSLKDKKILVYGTGAIGKEIARTAKFFQMTTLGVNSNGREITHYDQTYTMDDSLASLAEVDFVVNALPLTKVSKAYFNQVFFTKMKSSAYFINIGRGESVTNEDLLEALDKGQIAGAYLDVTAPEPLPEDSELWSGKNLVITPHVSGNVEHFREAIYPIFKENLDQYIQDKTIVINEYNRKKGY